MATVGFGSGWVSVHPKPKPELKTRTRPEPRFGWKSIPKTETCGYPKPDGLTETRKCFNKLPEHKRWYWIS
jgi:hypothetical protein